MFFIGTFLLNKYGLTDTAGQVDSRSFLFSKTYSAPSAQVLGLETQNNSSLTEIENLSNRLEELRLYKMKNFCKVLAINEYAGQNAQNIITAYKKTDSDILLSKMIHATEIKLAENAEYTLASQKCDGLTKSDSTPDLLATSLPLSNELSVYIWSQDDVGKALEEATVKDKEVIDKAAKIAGVEPRMLVAAMYAEQTRMWRTQRGLFKQYLAPLKILASANQFSLGVMGIKPKTAEEIEAHLKDPLSPYYLGVENEHLLNFSTGDIAKERYNRLAHPTDHVYSFLYGAILIKQIEKQWADAGYPIDYRPDIVSTLYNIGFKHSNPGPNPQAGGATMNISGTTYTYGALSYEFYYSGNLQNEFPFHTNTK